MDEDIEAEGEEFNIPGRMAIFTHECCTLKFDDEIKDYIYHMDENRAVEPYKFDVDDLKAHGSLFHEKIKAAFTGDMVITLDFNYLNVLCLFGIKDRMEQYGAAVWFIVSFFDDDETIRSRGEGAEALLEKKFDLIDRMIDFPFIQKRETPVDGLITAEYLHGLFNESIEDNPFLEVVE